MPEAKFIGLTVAVDVSAVGAVIRLAAESADMDLQLYSF